MLQILVVATIISLITGGIQDGWIGLTDGVSILIAIVLIVSINVVSTLNSQKEFDNMSAITDKATTVVNRGG